jgi:ribonuclease BN (tRNA processing enzyme)
VTDSNETTDKITFLGTGGARFMIISQILASGGMWLNLGGTQILLDPGPGCIVHATRRKFQPEALSAIVVSHRHLDHSGDVNVMIEAMTRGGFQPHGRLFVPADALEEEPIVFSYLRKRLDKIEILGAGKRYKKIGDVKIETPARHVHPVENYGVIFRTSRHSIAYISDTSYFDGLPDHYRTDLMIINVVFTEPRSQVDHPNTPVDHLSIPEVERLVSEVRPKAALLTHFGMGVWRMKPGRVAKSISQKTGVRVIAARDGMTFDLAELD